MHFLFLSNFFYFLFSFSVQNPWHITSSFWMQMMQNSTNTSGGEIFTFDVSAITKRCAMFVKDYIMIKKQKSTQICMSGGLLKLPVAQTISSVRTIWFNLFEKFGQEDIIRWKSVISGRFLHLTFPPSPSAVRCLWKITSW